jgi:hypothetical protein
MITRSGYQTVVDQVDRSAATRAFKQIVDTFAGEGFDPALQAAQLPRLKPGGGKLAIDAVVRVVHLRQGANQHSLAGHRLFDLGFELYAQQLGALLIAEHLVLSFDFDDVRMLGDAPERPVALRRGPVHRVVGAKAAEERVVRVDVAVGLAVGQSVVDRYGWHKIAPRLGDLSSSEF